MQNKYDSSWKVVHSLHLILLFIPTLGFIGFFFRRVNSGKRIWGVLGWVYLGITVMAFVASASGNSSFTGVFMLFYTFYYLAMLIAACVTLPQYLRDVIARRGGQQPSPGWVSPTQNAYNPSVNTPVNTPVNTGVVFTTQSVEPNRAPEPSTVATIQEIYRIGEMLKDQPIYKKLCGIEVTAVQILEYIDKNPGVKNITHTFTSYYLPEYLKLLRSYMELYQMRVKSDKMLETMAEIEESLPKTYESFQNLYNSLFTEKADDISNSIDVMEKMMSQDGLTEKEDKEDTIHLKL